MPLSLKDFTSVLRSLPKDANPDQINQAAKAAEAGTPLSQLWSFVNRPLGGSKDALIPALRHEHGPEESGLRTTAEDFGATLTSPVNAASMALGIGGAAAGARGLLGISKAARVSEAALQAPFVAEGVNNALTGDSMGERLAGVAEAGAGAYFGRQALKHSFPTQKVTQAYMQERGLPFDSAKPTPSIVPEQSMKRADAYVDMPHAPNDPRVKASYDALGGEVEQQYDFLVNRAGVKIEPWTSEGQPYTSSKHMVEDVEQNNHLWYFPSEQGFGMEEAAAGNPLLARGARNGVVLNDQLRAVHDYFGHAQHGFEFGPKGEEGAWMEHSKMLPKEAVGALTTETRGQNSFVNFGPHMRDAEGNLLKKGDPGFLGAAERPFAEQKTGLLPESLDAEEALNGPYGILSAAKSDLSPEENAARHQQLLAALKGRGAIEQHGVYGGGPEPSVLVPGLSPEETQAFGRQFNQEAVISSQGYHRLADGQTFPARGPARFDPSVADNYSELNGKRYQLDFPEEAYSAAPAPAAQPPATGRPLVGRTESLAASVKPSMDDMLQLEHRSTVDGLTEIDPAQWNNGKGMAGAERVLARDYPEHFQKQSFYNLKGSPIEKGLEHYPHTYEGLLPKSKIYDLGEDPLGLLQQARDIAGMDGRQIAALVPKLAKEAGFSGYINSKAEGDWAKGVVALFDKLPVQKRAAKAAGPSVYTRLANGEAIASRSVEDIKQAAGQSGRALADGVKKGGSTAMAVVGPTASASLDDSDPNDPNYNLKHYGKLALDVAGAIGLSTTALMAAKRLKPQSLIKDASARAAGALIMEHSHDDIGKQLLALGLPKDQIPVAISNGQKMLAVQIEKAGSKLTEVSKLLAFLDTGMGDADWYNTGKELKRYFGKDAAIMARLIAATSNNSTVKSNLTLALKAYAQWKVDPTQDIEGLMKTLLPNVKRAFEGDLEGRKVDNFAKAILGDPDAVVVDRWMMRAFGFKGVAPTPSQYDIIEHAIVDMAKKKGITPREVQASIWFGVKEEMERGKARPSSEPYGQLLRARFGSVKGKALTPVLGRAAANWSAAPKKGFGSALDAAIRAPKRVG